MLAARSRRAQPLQRQRRPADRRHPGARPARLHRRRDLRLAGADRLAAGQPRRLRPARRPPPARRRAAGREHRGQGPAADPGRAHRRQRQPRGRRAAQPGGVRAGRQRPARRREPAVRAEPEAPVHRHRVALPAERADRQRLLTAGREAGAGQRGSRPCQRARAVLRPARRADRRPIPGVRQRRPRPGLRVDRHDPHGQRADRRLHAADRRVDRPVRRRRAVRGADRQARARPLRLPRAAPGRLAGRRRHRRPRRADRRASCASSTCPRGAA